MAPRRQLIGAEPQAVVLPWLMTLAGVTRFGGNSFSTNVRQLPHPVREVLFVGRPKAKAPQSYALRRLSAQRLFRSSIKILCSSEPHIAAWQRIQTECLTARLRRQSPFGRAAILPEVDLLNPCMSRASLYTRSISHSGLARKGECAHSSIVLPFQRSR